MQTVYLETTVIGHIAGRLHPVASILARQQTTREWWLTARDRYRLFISDLVTAECGDGDSHAARERLEVIDGIDALQTTDIAKGLANLLIASHAVPPTEPRDALHIALAATNGIDYLATWNFKHIMNPATQHLIDDVCRNAGISSATICTPEQLLVTYGDS
ncbi:MAG: type II toxin-antitoxin system VapC family toxin [Pirellulaceae bacterium]|nr:type II toxin-antitoxin system VapC family toxin [Pirellulaceae bacterium]